jgi:hypothetical protein
MEHIDTNFDQPPTQRETPELPITAEERYLSMRREAVDAQWDTEQTKGPSETETGNRLVGYAEQRGEQIIEIDVPLKIKLPAGPLLDNLEASLEHAVLGAKKDLRAIIVAELNEHYPELVNAARTWKQNMQLLYKMVYPVSSETPHKTHLYDPVVAKGLLDECKALEDQYGHSIAGRHNQRYLREVFAEFGDPIE